MSNDIVAGELTVDEFRSYVRGLFRRAIVPQVENAERTGTFPKQLFEECGKAGLFELLYSQESDCLLLGVIWIEEAARVCAGISAGLMVQAGVGTSLIHDHASPFLKEKYLARALRGEIVSAFALSEPDAGSDVLSIRTRAEQDGDSYVLNGSKMYITNAPICDYMVVAAYTDPSAGRHGISLFVVDALANGVTVTTLRKHGHRSAATGAVYLEEVRVPGANVVGSLGYGFPYLLSALNVGRVLHAARSIGVARAALELGKSYLDSRLAFGHPLSDFQSCRFDMARVALATELAAEYTYSAARTLNGARRDAWVAAAAKVSASEAAVRATETVMHLHGGFGYMEDAPIERLVRDARLYPITEGTTEVQYELIFRNLDAIAHPGSGL